MSNRQTRTQRQTDRPALHLQQEAASLHSMRVMRPNSNNNGSVFNDIIWQAFGAAGIPAVKEPSGLDRQDGKRPDG